MFESLAMTVQEMGGAAYLVAVSVVLWTLVLLLFGFALIRRAKLRRTPDARFGYVPDAIAFLVAAAPLLMAVPAWRVPIEGLTRALATSDPSEKATHLAAALSTQLHAVSFTAFMVLSTSLAASVLLAVFIVQRHAGNNVGYTAGVGAGMIVGAPSVYGVAVLDYARQVVGTFGAVATADPDEKATLLQAGLDAAAPVLDSGLIAASAWLLVAFGLVAFSAFTRRTPVANPALQFVGAGLLVGAAVFLFVDTQPYAAENALPIAKSRGVDPGLELRGMTPPELEGPDLLVRAPVISVSVDRMTIEGLRVTNAEALGDKLVEMRKVEEMMRPDATFDGRLVVLADREVRGSHLAAAADGARRAEYVHWWIVLLVRGEEETRPLLGTRRAIHKTGVRVRVDEAPDAERVEVGADDRLEDLARRLVALRRDGREIALVFAP